MKYWCLFYGLVFVSFGLGVVIESIVNLDYKFIYMVLGFVLLIIGALKND